jgi:hypothetical protein
VLALSLEVRPSRLGSCSTTKALDSNFRPSNLPTYKLTMRCVWSSCLPRSSRGASIASRRISLFNDLPLRSNDTQKVIDTRYTFLLYFFVYSESHPRLLALSLEVFTLLAPRLEGSPEGRVSPQFASPVLLFTDNCPLACPDPVGVTAHHLTKLFRINTYGLSRKCGKQRTCRITKSFRIRTCKKQGGGGCYG